MQDWPKLKVLEIDDGKFYPPMKPGQDKMAVLQSAVPDSVCIQWEVNNTYTAQFTAYDDGSEAYNMLQIQNMVEVGDQWFVIKQIEPDHSGGLSTVQVTLSHVSNELSRLRNYNSTTSPIDWGNGGHYGGSGSSSLEVPSDTSDNNDNQIQQVLPQDILNRILQGNTWGITYQVIGQFNKANVQDPYASGSFKDYLDRIKEAWPDCVIYPDNLNIRVYSHDEFYKNHGNRIDYIHDTAEIQLTYDSTNMVNGARLVGATYSQDTTVNTGLPNGSAGKGATAVQRDAEKYLGVPYVWGGAGGARGGNPFSGMDCSSFVSQVYKDFGINIPAYTVSMEAYGHQVGSHQTGDMGFYGSHGASYHITLALDGSNMIFEPQPGESCKKEPISWYPPSWWERNDQMAAVVGSSDGDNGDTDNTTTDSKNMYYFAPFWYQDEDSVKRWGLFAGDDITSDTIQSKDEMKKYAETQFKPNPDIEIDATLESNQKPIPGDMVRVEVRPASFAITVAVVGYQWYLWSKTSQTTITLNSNGKNILDYDNSQRNKLQNIRDSLKRIETMPINISNGQETWTESEVKQYVNSKRN